MSYIYFDNNVLRDVFRLDEDSYNRLLTPVFSNGIELNLQYQIINSYFLVLEAIGIRTTFVPEVKTPSSYVEKIKQFQKDKITKKLADTTTDLFNHIFNCYKVEYEKSFKLSIDHLNQSYDEHLKSYGSEVRIFHDVVSRHFEDVDDFKESMIEWLSLERAGGHNYPKSIRPTMYSYIMHEANEFLEVKRNNSFAKFYYNLGQDLAEDILLRDKQAIPKTKKHYREFNITNPKRKKRRYLKFFKTVRKIHRRRKLIQRLQQEGKFGSARDNVDSEIVHLLVCGYQLHEIKKNFKVNVISSDRLEVLFSRVCLYKSYVQSAYKLRRKGNAKFNEGRFFFYDENQKKITHYLDIGKIPPFFSLDATTSNFESAYNKCVIALG